MIPQKTISGTQNHILLPVKSPLLCVATVQSVLHVASEVVIQMVQNGKLLYAFDLRHPNSSMVYLRVSTQSLSDFLNQASSQINLPIEDVLAAILPKGGPTISSVAVAHTFSVDADHVHSLRKSGCLKEFRRRHYKCQASQFCRRSVLDFLKTRRVL